MCEDVRLMNSYMYMYLLLQNVPRKMGSVIFKTSRFSSIGELRLRYTEIETHTYTCTCTQGLE